ncbi:hypothetical protein BJ085DRAFT_28430 [Dimargaris cristalligena]|uniref:Uncharacterized protein n=1 Tax=Dimargaris cristalligena TaxID=215637 RepID=A0A4P9ZTI1_9FUNG|nr:hypothetical protein BJ085DRAFT_28430 [Dimargaris cristalligena]|eukprot:RKP35840.1 hypothetical protein BJ085DRAFT_28430 [Dimargaris cristalligena]
MSTGIQSPQLYCLEHKVKKTYIKGHAKSTALLLHELRFTKLTLSIPKYSSCEDIWAHRKWAYRQLQSQIPIDNYVALLNADFALCDRSAAIYLRSYYSWNYRQFLLDCLLECLDGPLATRTVAHYITIGRILWHAWAANHLWIRLHIGDYSACNFTISCVKALGLWLQLAERVFVPQKIGLVVCSDQQLLDIPELQAVYRLLDLCIPNQAPSYSHQLIMEMVGIFELLFTEDLLRLYPDYESIWYHYRNATSLYLQYQFGTIKQSRPISCWGTSLVNHVDEVWPQMQRDLDVIGIQLTLDDTEPARGIRGFSENRECPIPLTEAARTLICEWEKVRHTPGASSETCLNSFISTCTTVDRHRIQYEIWLRLQPEYLDHSRLLP